MFRHAARIVILMCGLVVPPDCGADDVKLTHSFLAAGNQTFILDGSGKATWRYPQSSRDGWVLPNGNVLLALSKSKTYPGGTRAGPFWT